jgi:hypothetical protein
VSQPEEPTEPSTEPPLAWGESPPREWTWAPEPVTPPGRLALAMLVIAIGVAVLGVPFGLVWAAFAPDVPILVTERGPVYAVPQPEQLAAADGWFAFLAVPVGILAAFGGWFVARRMRGAPAALGAPGLVAVTVGAIGAALLAWWLGRHVGLSDYRETLAAAEAGSLLERPPDLRAGIVGWWPPRVLGVLLVPALAAAATYTLVAAWSPYPTLRRDEPLDLAGAEPDRPA